MTEVLVMVGSSSSYELPPDYVNCEYSVSLLEDKKWWSNVTSSTAPDLMRDNTSLRKASVNSQ